MIGVPILTPLGLNGEHGSFGMVFLLRAIPAWSRASDINHPLPFPTEARSRCVSVPPAASSNPYDCSSLAKTFAFLTIWWFISLNSGLSASQRATAIASVWWLCGHPCIPGNTDLSSFLAKSGSFLIHFSVVIIIAPLGPLSVLWVVVIITSAYGAGDTCAPDTTSPDIWDISARRYAPTFSAIRANSANGNSLA